MIQRRRMPQPRWGAPADHTRQTMGQETSWFICTYTYPCGSFEADTLKDLHDNAMIINSRTCCSRSPDLQMGSKPGINTQLHVCQRRQRCKARSCAILMPLCGFNVTWKRTDKARCRKKSGQMTNTYLEQIWTVWSWAINTDHGFAPQLWHFWHSRRPKDSNNTSSLGGSFLRSRGS